MKHLITLTVSILFFISACELTEENQGDETQSIHGSSQTENNVKSPENSEALCNDDIDNDQDGYIDMDDQDCNPYNPSLKYENTMILCTDGEDNDSDGRADCGDLDCDNWCNYSSFHEEMPEQTSSNDTEQSIYECDDTIDNDFDNKVDCNDPDCSYFCKRIENGPSLCNDGYDNDEDGYTDSEDSDCN